MVPTASLQKLQTTCASLLFAVLGRSRSAVFGALVCHFPARLLFARPSGDKCRKHQKICLGIWWGRAAQSFALGVHSILNPFGLFPPMSSDLLSKSSNQISQVEMGRSTGVVVEQSRLSIATSFCGRTQQSIRYMEGLSSSVNTTALLTQLREAIINRTHYCCTQCVIWSDCV